MMGRAHSYGYRVAPMLRHLPVTPVVTVMSGRDAAAAAAAASAYGIPQTVTDWRELMSRDAVDVVDVFTPPGTHARLGRALAAWVREARSSGLDDDAIESLLRVTLQAAAEEDIA